MLFGKEGKILYFFLYNGLRFFMVDISSFRIM